jgi:hypothetical protein
VSRKARRALAIVALSAPVVLGACGSTPELSKELDTVRSWTATAQLAAAERRAGATNRALTAQLSDAAHEALAEAGATLPNAAGPAAERSSVRAAVDSLAAALRLLDAASAAP